MIRMGKPIHPLWVNLEPMVPDEIPFFSRLASPASAGPFSLGTSISPGEVTPGILAMFGGGLRVSGELRHCSRKDLS